MSLKNGRLKTKVLKNPCVFEVKRCTFLQIIHAFFQDGLVLGQPLLKIEHAFVFWELKFIREICKCSFCKHKRCGARLKGKLRTTKDFRSIPGAYLRSGRISSVAWSFTEVEQ